MFESKHAFGIFSTRYFNVVLGNAQCQSNLDLDDTRVQGTILTRLQSTLISRHNKSRLGINLVNREIIYTKLYSRLYSF